MYSVAFYYYSYLYCNQICVKGTVSVMACTMLEDRDGGMTLLINKLPYVFCCSSYAIFFEFLALSIVFACLHMHNNSPVTVLRLGNGNHSNFILCSPDHFEVFKPSIVQFRPVLLQ